MSKVKQSRKRSKAEVMRLVKAEEALESVRQLSGRLELIQQLYRYRAWYHN